MLITVAAITVASFVYIVGRWHYHAAEMHALNDMLLPAYRRNAYGERTSYVHVAGGWRRTAQAAQFVAIAEMTRNRVLIHDGEVIPY